MTEYDQERRIRVLRAGAYRCGVRVARVLCGAPAADVDELYRYPVCAQHALTEESHNG